MIKIRKFITKSFYFVMRLEINFFVKQIDIFWKKNKKYKIDEINYNLSLLNLTDPRNESLVDIKQLNLFSSMGKKDIRTNVFNAPYSRHTSGTTGDPVYVFLNRQELGRMLAVREYCLNYIGLSLGDREARVWGRRERGIKGFLKDFLLNRKSFHPVGDRGYSEVVSLLSYNPDYLYGYASLVLEAAKIVQAKKLTVPDITAIIVTAENILPSQKSYISKIFNAPVFEEYGSTEFDIIAFECREGHRHFVNPWLVTEEVEGKFVVTDVSRISQSFIRYDIGDLVEFCSSPCCLIGGQHAISRIEGRSINRFAIDYNYKKFHSTVFSRAVDAYMNKYEDFFSFCIVQNTFGVLNLSVSAEPRLGYSHISKFLKKYVCDSENVDIEFVVDNVSAFKSIKQSYFIQNISEQGE